MNFVVLSRQIEQAANEILEQGSRRPSWLLVAFGVHLRLIAAALYEIGMVEADKGKPGDEDEFNRVCLSPNLEADAARQLLEVSIISAQESIQEAQAVLERMKP